MEYQTRRKWLKSFGNPVFSSAVTQLIIIHEAAHVKPPGTLSSVAGGGTDWLFRCTFDIFGTVYACFTIMSGAKQRLGFICNFSLTKLICFSSLYLCICMRVCMRRLCVCDMDRLGRNEFIGEVRVALKKLKEGENKRYYMGLERIAQVGIVCARVCILNGFLWTYILY